MAATITSVDSTGELPSAPTRVRRVTVLGDNAPPGGGYLLALATKFPGEEVVGVICQPAAGATPAIGEYNYATDALVFLKVVDGTAIADCTGITLTILIFTR